MLVKEKKTFSTNTPAQPTIFKILLGKCFPSPPPPADSTHIQRWKFSLTVCVFVRLHVGRRYIIRWKRREKKKDFPFIKALRNYILYSTFVLATIGNSFYDSSKDNYFLVIAAPTEQGGEILSRARAARQTSD